MQSQAHIHTRTKNSRMAGCFVCPYRMGHEGEIEGHWNWTGWIKMGVRVWGGRVFQNPLFDSLDIRDIHKI